MGYYFCLPCSPAFPVAPPLGCGATMDRLPPPSGCVNPFSEIFLKKFFSKAARENPFIRARKKEITRKAVKSRQDKWHKRGRHKRITAGRVKSGEGKRAQEDYTEGRKEKGRQDDYSDRRKHIETRIAAGSRQRKPDGTTRVVLSAHKWNRVRGQAFTLQHVKHNAQRLHAEV